MSQANTGAPPLEPRLSRFNNAFAQVTRESNPTHSPLSFVNTRSGSNASYTASPQPDIDREDTSWDSSRGPSTSFDDPTAYAYTGRVREFSIERGNYDPYDPHFEYRHNRGFSMASVASAQSFMAENFPSNRGVAGSMDDSEDTVPGLNFFNHHEDVFSPPTHIDQQVGHRHNFSTEYVRRIQLDPGVRFAPNDGAFHNRDHDRRMWRELEQRLKDVKHQAFDLSAMKADIEMILDGTDIDSDNRFREFANVLQRVDAKPYDDSKTISEQVLNLELPGGLLDVLELLDKDPKDITKKELRQARRGAYEHAANQHTRNQEYLAQVLILTEMSKLAADIENGLKEFSGATSHFVGNLLGELEQEVLTKNEVRKKEHAALHYHRQTVELKKAIIELQTQISDDDSDEEEESPMLFLPTLPNARVGGKSPSESSAPKESNELKSLQNQLLEEHKSNTMRLEREMSELKYENQVKLVDQKKQQQVLKGKLKEKDAAYVELMNMVDQLNEHLESYRQQERVLRQELSDTNMQLDMYRRHLQGLEAEVAKDKMPKEFAQVISLQSELNMMRFQSNSIMSDRSYVGMPAQQSFARVNSAALSDRSTVSTPAGTEANRVFIVPLVNNCSSSSQSSKPDSVDNLPIQAPERPNPVLPPRQLSATSDAKDLVLDDVASSGANGKERERSDTLELTDVESSTLVIELAGRSNSSPPTTTAAVSSTSKLEMKRNDTEHSDEFNNYMLSNRTTMTKSDTSPSSPGRADMKVNLGTQKRPSSIQVTEPPPEQKENILLRNKVADLEKRLEEAQAYLKFSFDTISKMEKEKQQPNVSAMLWEEEKQQYLNVISRVEAESDTLKGELNKARKKYKKLLKARPSSSQQRTEVSSALFHSALNAQASRRSVIKFFSNFCQADNWIHRTGDNDVQLYRLNFEAEEIWCRFSLLYPVIILLGTTCGIEKRSIGYVTLLASGVKSKKAALSKLIGDIQGMCMQRKSQDLYLFIFTFFKSLFYFHDSLSSFIGARNPLLLEFSDPEELVSLSRSLSVIME